MTQADMQLGIDLKPAPDDYPPEGAEVIAPKTTFGLINRLRASPNQPRKRRTIG